MITDIQFRAFRLLFVTDIQNIDIQLFLCGPFSTLDLEIQILSFLQTCCTNSNGLISEPEVQYPSK